MIFRLGKCLKIKKYLSTLLEKGGTYLTGHPFKNVSLIERALFEGSYFTKDGPHQKKFIESSCKEFNKRAISPT